MIRGRAASKGCLLVLWLFYIQFNTGTASHEPGWGCNMATLTVLSKCLWYMGIAAKNVGKTMLLLPGPGLLLWDTKTDFIPIVGGLIGLKTMPPFNTNLNKNAKVIFLAGSIWAGPDLVRIVAASSQVRNGTKTYLGLLSISQTICIKSCNVL